MTSVRTCEGRKGLAGEGPVRVVLSRSSRSDRMVPVSTVGMRRQPEAQKSHACRGCPAPAWQFAKMAVRPLEVTPEGDPAEQAAQALVASPLVVYEAVEVVFNGGRGARAVGERGAAAVGR